LDGATDEALKGFERIAVLTGQKRDSHPVHVGPPGTTDAVNVIFGVGRKVKINDVGDSVYVDSAGRDIGGHENTDFSILEILQSAGPLVLAAVGMKGSGGNSVTAQLPGNSVRAVFSAGEYQNGVQLIVLQKVLEQAELLRLRNFVNKLFNRVGGVGPAADFNGLGLVLKFVSELFDLTRQGGGEKKGLPVFLGEVLYDTANVGQKAHVQHAVGFVKNEKLQAGEIGASLIHKIHQPAWSGDNQINSVAKSFFLGTFPHSAVNGSYPERNVLGICLYVIVDLDNQLAGRRDDKGAGLATTLPLPVKPL
jgi:hypothetical protein